MPAVRLSKSFGTRLRLAVTLLSGQFVESHGQSSAFSV
jgi:hypothetical protein